MLENGKHVASAHASFAEKCLTPNRWHILGHIDSASNSHLKKRGLIDVVHTTVASEMVYSVCKGCKSEALSCGCDGRRPKTPGGVVYTNPGGSVHANVIGIKYVQCFAHEASRDNRVIGLKTRDAALTQRILHRQHGPWENYRRRHRRRRR